MAHVLWSHRCADNFAGLRREQGAPDLLRAAEPAVAAVAAARPDDDRLGLVHGEVMLERRDAFPDTALSLLMAAGQTRPGHSSQ